MAKLLLIEPNTLLVRTYQETLCRAGFEVVCAAGAQMAIEAADLQTPDLVILELQLPEHSGLEFLHEFRSYAEWQRVPVIVHTMVSPSHLRAVEDALTSELGVRAILYKPRTHLDELVRAVREQLAMDVSS